MAEEDDGRVKNAGIPPPDGCIVGTGRATAGKGGRCDAPAHLPDWDRTLNLIIWRPHGSMVIHSSPHKYIPLHNCLQLRGRDERHALRTQSAWAVKLTVHAPRTFVMFVSRSGRAAAIRPSSYLFTFPIGKIFSTPDGCECCQSHGRNPATTVRRLTPSWIRAEKYSRSLPISFFSASPPAASAVRFT